MTYDLLGRAKSPPSRERRASRFSAAISADRDTFAQRPDAPIDSRSGRHFEQRREDTRNDKQGEFPASRSYQARPDTQVRRTSPVYF